MEGTHREIERMPRENEWQPCTSLRNRENAREISALIDKCCECYAAIDKTLADSISLRTVKKVSQRLRRATADMRESGIRGVVALRLEMNFLQTVYAYRVANLAFLLILGNSWKVHNRVRTVPEEGRSFYGQAGRWMPETKRKPLDAPWPGEPAEEYKEEPTTHAVVLTIMQ